MAIPFYKRFELKLTSPAMQDGKGALKNQTLVRDTQYLLNGHSKNALNNNKPFGDFLKGTGDGVYGPLTASAVRQAKWSMGYPTAQCNSVAGPIFQDYLRGNSKLPLTYRARRKARIDGTVRERAVNKAKSQVGVTENPANSNRVKYSEWYGIIGPWCAMFTTWCFKEAGSKRFEQGHRYAYVPFIVDDARAGRNGLHLTNDPIKGDLVCYDWNDDGEADHVGFFDHWLDRSAGTFATVEGNTSMTNQSNGGAVMQRQRSKSDVQAFVRVLEP